MTEDENTVTIIVNEWERGVSSSIRLYRCVANAKINWQDHD